MRNRGFTLFEMTAVVAIIVLFAAMVTPNLLARRTSREVTAFFVALPDLAVFAREQAQRKETTVRVRYDETRTSFVVEADSKEANADPEQIRELAMPEGLRITAFRQEDQSVASGEWEVIFYPDGRSDGAGVEVDDNRRVRSITVTPEGTVRTEDGPLPAMEERRWPAGEREQRA